MGRINPIRFSSFIYEAKPQRASGNPNSSIMHTLNPQEVVVQQDQYPADAPISVYKGQVKDTRTQY